MKAIFLSLCILGLSACADHSNDSPDDAVPAPAAAGVKTSEILGHFNGDWGDMEFRVVGQELWGSYSHDEGTVVVTWSDTGFLQGWWSEKPTRLPTNDAGEVQFKFTKAGGVVSLDGWWRYGDTGVWNEDWDLTHTDAAVPAELSARFNDPSQFKRHP